MLDQERNQILTHIGRGTPMGELMRRYWHHALAAVSELEDTPVKPVRLMGEDARSVLTPSKTVNPNRSSANLRRPLA